MGRVRLNRYKRSKSGRALARYLGIKMLKLRGSRFRGRYDDVVINWGNGKGNIGNARQINKLSSIQLASNKLRTLEALQANDIPIPRYSMSLLEFEPSDLLYGRSELYGHSGRGIVIGTQEELYNNMVDCPLYTKAIDKVAEYRVIVVGDEVVDFKQKLKKRDYEGHDEYIWNHGNGYVFARDSIESAPIGIGKLGIDSVKALGLDFGAVDIVEDSDGKLYTLEVNTAFGIEGQTLSLVGDAIRRLL
jgi:hypothetical protein